MPIVLTRIDDRLIHGQVVEGWLKKIRVTHIVVVSDEVADDEMQKTLLGMAAPGNVKVSIFSVENAAGKFKTGEALNDFLLILFSNPKDVLRFIEHGINLPAINVGGMHYSSGKIQVLPNVSVDAADISAFVSLNNLGVELECRILPDDAKVNVISVIKEKIPDKI